MTRLRWPTVDHNLLSRSGRCSKRARKAAEAIEFARLFRGVGDLKGERSAAEKRASRVSGLRQHAALLRDLAAKGTHPRKYPQEAARLEAEAAALEAAP